MFKHLNYIFIILLLAYATFKAGAQYYSEANPPAKSDLKYAKGYVESISVTGKESSLRLKLGGDSQKYHYASESSRKKEFLDNIGEGTSVLIGYTDRHYFTPLLGSERFYVIYSIKEEKGWSKDLDEISLVRKSKAYQTLIIAVLVGLFTGALVFVYRKEYR